MTKQEFEQRVKMTVSADEYAAIETVYLNCDLDKDEFCKMWCKMNKSRINAAKEQAKYDAMTASQKAFHFIRKEAAKRSELTGSSFPKSDVEYDIKSLADIKDYENFTIYFVLRDTGAEVTTSKTQALDAAKVFSNSNAVVYEMNGCRCLDYLKIEEIA